MSPTQRTLADLKKHGWTAQVVEKWNPHARIRQDLFGCIDILALPPVAGNIHGIQACADGSHAARLKKALAEPRLKQWLRCGGIFHVMSWGKKGPRGKRKVWRLRMTTLSMAGSELLQTTVP